MSKRYCSNCKKPTLFTCNLPFEKHSRCMVCGGSFAKNIEKLDLKKIIFDKDNQLKSFKKLFWRIYFK